MSEPCTAGRAFVLATILALAACGPAPGSRAPSEAQILPTSGPLAPATLKRLLLVDAVRVGSRIVAVGDEGFILLSDDDGASWQRAAAPDAPLLTAVFFVDAKNGWAVGHDATILATTDGGATWTREFSAPSEQRPLLDVLFLDTQRGIAVGAYGAYYETSDGGRSWTARKIIPEDKHLNAIVRLSSSGSVGGAGQRLLIFGEEGTILASNNEGRDWTKVASPYKGSFLGGLVAADGSVLCFGLRGRIYRSTDGGETWAQAADPSTATLMGGTRLPDGTLVITGGAATVLVSRDDGRSFAPLGTTSARVYSTAVAGKGGDALIVGDGGVRSLALAAAGKAGAR